MPEQRPDGNVEEEDVSVGKRAELPEKPAAKRRRTSAKEKGVPEKKLPEAKPQPDAKLKAKPKPRGKQKVDKACVARAGLSFQSAAQGLKWGQVDRKRSVGSTESHSSDQYPRLVICVTFWSV